MRGRRDEKLSLSNNTGRGAAVKLEAATVQQHRKRRCTQNLKQTPQANKQQTNRLNN
jgi:hypothetical protein